MTAFPPSPEQLSVIDAELRPAVVVAGAGSGKTETMANRVVGLIRSGAVEPGQILGLTFTRKAAGELGGRIRGKLQAEPGGLGAGEPAVSTYDAFSARIVTEHAMRLGREPRVEILRPAAAYALAAAVVDRFESRLLAQLPQWPSRGTVISAICQLHERLAVHGRTPDELVAFSTGQLSDLLSIGVSRTGSQLDAIRQLATRESVRPVVAELVARYRALLESRGLMDFAAVAALAAELAAVPAVREVERASARVVLLDEFQDTSPVQLELLAGLFGGCAVTAVGDPNQAIFAWRGAGSDTLGEFRDRFGRADCLELHLSTSYRNTPPVLAVANALAGPLRAAERRIAVPELQPFLPATEDAVGGSAPPSPPAMPPPAVLVSRFSTEPREARAVAAAAARELAAGRSAAVLVRTRRQIPMLLATMRAAGLPVRVVGLSGLLGVPAVIDVVSVLEVLTDADRADALLRILTGSRWRIGPQDLRALHRLARRLDPRERGQDRSEDAAPGIVDALDLLADRGGHGPAAGAGFSAAGADRLHRLARELQTLRQRLDQPLPDLVIEVVRTIGIDVELAAAGAPTAGTQADLDSFVAEADAFAASAGSVAFAAGRLSDTARSAVSLSGFLAFLDLAADAERGLDRDETALDFGDLSAASSAVDLLTVHAAKGLEWDAVFVPGMSADVFPTGTKSAKGWLTDPGEIPGPLRRDRRGQAELQPLRGVTSDEARTILADFEQQAKDAHRAEERRLAYVAVTRARHSLWCSGYAWSPTLKKARGHSAFLDEIRALAPTGQPPTDRVPSGQVPTDRVPPGQVPPVRVGTWEPDGPNPLELGDPDFAVPSGEWPYDPLGSARRQAVEAGAALVRTARRRLAGRAGPGLATPGGPHRTGARPGPDRRPAGEQPALELELAGEPRVPPTADPLQDRWAADVAALCAGARLAAAGRELTVELPAALTVSDLVSVARDPQALASRLRRPMPQPPRPAADLGTAFHEWLERRWRQEGLIDLEDVPGASDTDLEVYDAAALERLQDGFASSAWSDRTPEHVEYPFLMPLGPVVLRGRIDAVFTDDPSGVVDIVDWKTGRPPHGEAELSSVAVQLAAYRLAWHRMHGVPLDRIRAAFHYVAANRTVAPADLLDAAQLERLVTGS